MKKQDITIPYIIGLTILLFVGIFYRFDYYIVGSIGFISGYLISRWEKSP